MPTAVIMPKFEMTQESGTVASWLKCDGDVVKKGDVILEVETDKLNQEVEAMADGTLTGITAWPGDVVPIGQIIAYIVKPGESLAPPAEAQSADPEELAMSARVTPAASPLAARMAESLGVDLALVSGSGPRGQVTREDVEAFATEQQSRGMAEPSIAAPADGKLSAVPAARRLARELGVDLRLVHGAGPEGRIQSAEVRAHFAGASAGRSAVRGPAALLSVQAEPTVSTVPAGGFAPAQAGAPAIRRLAPLTNIRRTIAERMIASVREAPQFTVSLDADMTRALATLEDLRAGDAAGGQPRVTLTALLIKAVAWALSRHPGANAAYQDGQIAEYAEVNVGVATAIEAGLIVPVIRQADQLGVRTIAARLADLTTRGRDNRLKLEDLQGGTCTLSNLGMFGIDQFTAILNPPQATILAVGRVAKRPVVLADDRVDVRPQTMLTLTADHRVLDGVTAAQFLATIQRVLEHPGLLLE